MSKTEPTLSESYEKLNSRWKRLADDAKFASLQSGIRSLDQQIDGLAEAIAGIRERGFVFEKSLESDARKIRVQWSLRQRSAEKIITTSAEHLKKLVRDAERQLNIAEKRIDLHDNVTRKLDLIDSEVDDTARRVNESLRESRTGASEISDVVREADFLLDTLDEASFDLLPNEHVVGMRRVESGGHKGVLFLTDQRILFERRKKKAKKKRLFVTVKRVLVAELEWAAPVGAVVDVSAEDKGGFIGIGDKDLLTLTFADVADVPEEVTVRFLKKSDNEAWAETVIPHVSSGNIAQEMIKKAADKVAAFDTSNLPTTCPNCHASLPKIYRGMHQVSCEYCGTTVNIS